MRLRLFVLLTICSMLLACSNPFTRIQAPSVSISQLSLVDAQLLEQRYRLRLRIQNPNPYALPISGLQYRLYLNGLEFARGVSSQSVTIPAYEERMLEVDMISTIGTLVEQLRRWRDVPNGELRYRLAGEVNLSTRFVPVGFEYHGTIPLDKSLGEPLINSIKRMNARRKGAKKRSLFEINEHLSTLATPQSPFQRIDQRLLRL